MTKLEKAQQAVQNLERAMLELNHISTVSWRNSLQGIERQFAVEALTSAQKALEQARRLVVVLTREQQNEIIAS